MAAGDIIEEPDEQPGRATPAQSPTNQPGQIIAEPDGDRGPQIGGAQPVESLSVLPFSRDPTGWRFDPRAGVMGALGSAFNLPGDIATGRASMSDPATQQRAIAAGAMITPDAGYMSGKATMPSSAALKIGGNQGIDAATKLGVNYPRTGVQTTAMGWGKDLYDNNLITGKEAPRAFSAWRSIRMNPDGSVPLSEVERVRGLFSKLSQDANVNERAAGAAGLKHIDNFYSDPQWADPASGATGPVQQATAMLNDGRANRAAAFRSDRWTQMGQDAKEGSQAPNAGSYANILRQKMNSFARSLDDPQYPGRVKGGYNEAERQAALNAGASPPGQSAIHAVNKIVGEGGWLPWLGEKMGGWKGAVLGFGAKGLGYGLEQATERGAHGAFEHVDELIRSRSPMGQQAAMSPPKVVSPVQTGAVGVARQLAAQGINTMPPVSVEQPYTPATPDALSRRQPELYD